jgi:lipopolysaccharide/colanic/teichoic acid biosynthesis glycosyltransferase
MQRDIKRLMDICLALAGLLVASPVMLAVAVAVRVTMGSPVFFRQERAGWHGRPFAILKFRTLRSETVAPDGRHLSSVERLTPLGSFLRSRSLDELPQLWNVVRGEMSIVGPRPLYASYIDGYSREQARRLDVRPGITGWAQVQGRQDIDFRQRFDLDVWYVDNWSLILDARVIVRTIRMIVSGSGVAEGAGVTEPLWDYSRSRRMARETDAGTSR